MEVESYVHDSNDPNKVILQKFSILVEGRDEVSIDLTESKEDYEVPFIFKEGAAYKMKIDFYVQRAIVAGLKYHHEIKRKGVSVDKLSEMVGSYGPKSEPQTFTTPEQSAPKGMLYRGHYDVSSRVTDDNKIVYATWKWHFDVKKDW